MDHDVLHKDVAKLKGFVARAEASIAFVEGLKAAGFKAPEAGQTLPADDHQKIVDEVVQLLGPKVQDLVGRVEKIEQAPQGGSATIDLSPIESRLTKLEEGTAKPEAIADDQDLSDRLSAMLTWFEANQEGLELLLALDGDVDEDKPKVDTGSDGAGTGSGGAASVTGASGDGTSTDGTTGSVEGLPGTSQDPSVDAEKANDQPVAKP